MSGIKSGLNNVKVVTWEKVKEATQRELSELIKYVTESFPSSKESIPVNIMDFWSLREGLYVFDGVLLYNDRVVIPPCLRKDVLHALHSAHQGVSGITLNAQDTVFWPGITRDIELERLSCSLCTKITPQPKLPPVEPHVPSTPFEAIVADYFKHEGFYYLVVADRPTGWPEIYRIRIGTDEAGARGLLVLLKRYFGSFGVPVEISTDGGPEFKAHQTQNFLSRWGIHCCMLHVAYHSQSNSRAEVAVKSMKRLLGESLDSNGSLDTAKFLQAILVYRNTPDPTCGISPAEMVFGRKLRDTLPRLDKSKNVYFNEMFKADWREAWAAKECALRNRSQITNEKLSKNSRALMNLAVGDRVSIQNQYGSNPKRWDCTGVVMEVHDFDQYVVKVDGAGRLTVRNRKFLKKLLPDQGMLPNLPYKFTACAPRNVDNFRSTLPHLKKTILPSLAEDDVSELSASRSKALSHRSCDLRISLQESILSDVVPLSPPGDSVGGLPSGNSVGGSWQGEQSSMGHQWGNDS